MDENGASDAPSPAEAADHVLVVDVEGRHAGFASITDWQPERLLLSASLPSIKVLGAEEQRAVYVASLKRVIFVHSHEAPAREAIHFYDGVSRYDVLWVRLRLRGDDWREGFIANSAQLFMSPLIGLRPSDPESNERLVLFPASEILDFQVLGLRSAQHAGKPYED